MLRVRLVLSGWTGGPGLATFYYTSGTEDAAAAARCRGYVQDLWNNAAGILMWNDVVGVVSPEVDEMTSADGAIINTFTDPTVLGANGTGGASEAPPAIAGLLHYSTATFLGGRRLRGRTFVSPLALQKLQADGTLDDVALAASNVGSAANLAGLTAGDNMVVWHRPKLGIGGATGVVTGITVANKLAVLTSRRD